MPESESRQTGSTINVTSLTGFAGFAPGGAFGSAQYGSFSLGIPSVTGAFTGTDGGASTTDSLVTGQDTGTLAGQCAAGTLKAIALGIGTITLQ